MCICMEKSSRVYAGDLTISVNYELHPKKKEGYFPLSLV